VLCVDDHLDTAESQATVLNMVGFDARACLDGATAIEVAREFVPDVCLLDLHMPKMDGAELAERLREQAGGRPLLLLAVTANGDPESRRLTGATGCSAHLLKPVDLGDLVTAVDEHWKGLQGTGRPPPDGSSA
jgi:CheY-like chemotaxis protein